MYVTDSTKECLGSANLATRKIGCAIGIVENQNKIKHDKIAPALSNKMDSFEFSD